MYLTFTCQIPVDFSAEMTVVHYTVHVCTMMFQHYLSMKVSSKTKHVVHYNVKCGDIIIWEFATKKRDIGFGEILHGTCRYSRSLLPTLGAPAQRGLWYLVCHSVCVSICLLPLIPRTRRGPKSNTNGFGTTLPLFFKWWFINSYGIKT